MIPLANLLPGESGEVVQISSTDSNRLMKLAALGLAPGITIRLQQRSPVFVIRVGETILSIERKVAEQIWLKP